MKGRWLHILIMAAGIVLLIAGHGIILYFVSSHVGVSTVVAVFLLIVLKHLGVFGSGYALLRRRWCSDGSSRRH